jgi:hypothetical protein
MHLTGWFKTIVCTGRRCKLFLEKGHWSASPEFMALPYLWHRPRRGWVHHMADDIWVNSLVARELGFDSPFSYVKSHGWTISLKKGHYTLQYQKIQEAIVNQPTSERTRDLCCTFTVC